MKHFLLFFVHRWFSASVLLAEPMNKVLKTFQHFSVWLEDPTICFSFLEQILICRNSVRQLFPFLFLWSKVIFRTVFSRFFLHRCRRFTFSWKSTFVELRRCACFPSIWNHVQKGNAQNRIKMWSDSSLLNENKSLVRCLTKSNISSSVFLLSEI